MTIKIQNINKKTNKNMFIEFIAVGDAGTLKELHSYVVDNDYSDGNDEIDSNGHLYFSFNSNGFPKDVYNDIVEQYPSVQLFFSMSDEKEGDWVSNDLEKIVFKNNYGVLWEDEPDSGDYETEYFETEEQMKQFVFELGDVPYSEDVDIWDITEKLVGCPFCERLSIEEIEERYSFQ